MELFFRKIGSGKPLIILHGLFGSSDNWLSVAKLLEHNFDIYLLDQRNHGHSPHSNEFNYNVLTNDLKDFLTQHNITNANIMGHSMGGKVAMHFAKNYPELINSLIVVDIAPINYSENIITEKSEHSIIINTLAEINLTQITSRSQVYNILYEKLKSDKLCNFILKSLHRNANGTYSWLLNICSLKYNLQNISDGFNNFEWNNIEITKFPILFIKGENSNYISNNYKIIINKIFPESELIEISNAGHWLHAEKPNEFVKSILYFTEKNKII